MERIVARLRRVLNTWKEYRAVTKKTLRPFRKSLWNRHLADQLVKALLGSRSLSIQEKTDRLRSLTRHEKSEFREVAAGEIPRLGLKVDESLEILKPLLRDPCLEVRAAAAGSLGSLRPVTDVLLDTLIQELGDSRLPHNDRVRQIVCGALEKIGPAAQKAIASVAHCVTVPPNYSHYMAYYDLNSQAARTLLFLGEKGMDALCALLREQRPRVLSSIGVALYYSKERAGRLIDRIFADFVSGNRQQTENGLQSIHALCAMKDSLRTPIVDRLREELENRGHRMPPGILHEVEEALENLADPGI